MKESHTSLLLLVCVTAATAGLLAFPETISTSVSDALALCANILLPTLFPFMILSGFIVKSGLAHFLGEKAGWFMPVIFHLPGVCFAPLLLGILGGYPTGAKTLVNLYNSGACSKRDAEHTLAFCSNCGPGFLISSIGFGMFGAIRYGIFLYAVHIIAAFLCGIIFAPPEKPVIRTASISRGTNTSVSSAFVGSVCDALPAFLNLCSFVLCFSAIVPLFLVSEIPALLASPLPFSGSNGQWFLLGLLEMTAGIRHLTAGTLGEKLVLTAVLAAWGGLSVHCQVISLLRDTGLSARFYWRGKLLHAALSALLICLSVVPIPTADTMTLIFLAAPFSFLLFLKKRSGNTHKNVL